jgi:Flp pilus assembly protein TadG
MKRGSGLLRSALAIRKACAIVMPKERCNEDGSSLVETALVLAILAPLLLLGTFEMGGLIYASIELSDSAHAAAAYAAQYYISDSGSALPTQSQVSAAAENDAPELLAMLSSESLMTTTMATGCGTGAATAGSTVPSCSSGTLPYVQVTVEATVSPLVRFLSFLQSPTMASQARINLVN